MSYAEECIEDYWVLVGKGIINPKKLSVDKFVNDGGAPSIGEHAIKALGWETQDESR